MTEKTWGVVLTADEPAELVLANVSWHLAHGAAQMHVYLDQPDDPVAAMLSQIKNVRVVRCDGAHWQRLNGGRRPKLQMRRQSLNANDAQNFTDVDWMVHLDADEFLLQSRPLGTELPFVEDLEAELYIPVWERFHEVDPQQIFEGAFRGTTKAKPGFDAQIFGAQNKYLIHGVLAHSAGKCAVPVGRGFLQGIHWSFKGTQKRENRAPRYESTTSRVLHFDGLTPLHWLIKVMRYANHDPDDLARLLSGQRHAQIEFILSRCAGMESALAAQRELRFLNPDQVARLDGFGLIDRPLIDLPTVVQDILGYLPDFSVDAFDTALRSRYPDIAAVLEAGI